MPNCIGLAVAVQLWNCPADSRSVEQTSTISTSVPFDRKRLRGRGFRKMSKGELCGLFRKEEHKCLLMNAEDQRLYVELQFL